VSGPDLDAGPDPAIRAAREPEPPLDEARVHAVGVGPGSDAFLTGRAERLLDEADVVVGFETVVDHARSAIGGDALTCGYRDEAETLARFADRVAAGDRGVAVLMGDPNHSGYQFLGKVERAVDADVRLVPGISSLQVAASRARTPMERSTFVTLHQSGDLTAERERLRADVGERHLQVLPRPYDLMPGDVAADLLETGADPDRPALVLERLTHDDEAITRTTLGDLSEHAGGDDPADSPFSDLSVLVVRAESPTGGA